MIRWQLGYQCLVIDIITFGGTVCRNSRYRWVREHHFLCHPLGTVRCVGTEKKETMRICWVFSISSEATHIASRFHTKTWVRISFQITIVFTEPPTVVMYVNSFRLHAHRFHVHSYTCFLHLMVCDLLVYSDYTFTTMGPYAAVAAAVAQTIEWQKFPLCECKTSQVDAGRKKKCLLFSRVRVV